MDKSQQLKSRKTGSVKPEKMPSNMMKTAPKGSFEKRSKKKTNGEGFL